MPRLVVGDHAPLLRILQRRPGAPEHDFILRLLKIRHGDLVPAMAGRRQRRLVAEVRQIRAVEAGGGAGQKRQVDIGGQVQLAGVDAQDAFAALAIGERDRHLAVETPRAQ